MRVRSIQIENFRALRAIDISFDGPAMLIGESGAGCSTLMLAIDRLLGEPPPEGLVRINEQDFHADRTGRRADTLSLRLTIEPTPERPNPRLLAEAFGPGVSESAPLIVRVRARRESSGAPSVSVARERDGGAEETLGPKQLTALRRCAPSILLNHESFRLALRDPAEVACLPSSLAGNPTSRLFTEVRRIAALGSAVTPADVAAALVLLREYITQRREQPDAAESEDPRRGTALVDQVGPAPIPSLETLDLFSDPEDPRAVALLTAVGVLSEATRNRPSEPDAEPVLLLDNIGAGLHPRWLAALAAIVGGLPGQKIVHTQSQELISWVRLESLRRLETVAGVATVHQVDPHLLSTVQARRIAHHIRRARAGALLSRCWLLVEGESEAWLLPEFTRLMGLDLRVEGVYCVEFAQAGLDVMIRLADMLGIGWILFVDGDQAGDAYTDVALSLLGRRNAERHIVRLPSKDIERYLFQSGFAPVYEKAAGRTETVRSRRRADPSGVIRAAIKAKSKPDLALAVLEEAHRHGPDWTPPEIRRAIELAVALARAGATKPGRGASESRGRRRRSRG